MINILAAEMTNTWEHYYDPESGSGYLAWQLKTIQRKTSEERGASGSKSPKFGGPGHVRQPFISDDVPTDEDVEAAIAVLRYSADEDTVRAKMKTTFIYRQAMIEQEFRLMFELLDLMRNAESAVEVENGWDSDMSAILLLLHLLPPSAQGRKRPGKMSASQAVDQLIRCQKVGTSVQQHLDSITQAVSLTFLPWDPQRAAFSPTLL
ncbi:hypothetical protein AOLI_G00072040 [Acnodon oligacanthus]